MSDNFARRRGHHLHFRGNRPHRWGIPRQLTAVQLDGVGQRRAALRPSPSLLHRLSPLLGYAKTINNNATQRCRAMPCSVVAVAFVVAAMAVAAAAQRQAGVQQGAGKHRHRGCRRCRCCRCHHHRSHRRSRCHNRRCPDGRDNKGSGDICRHHCPCCRNAIVAVSPLPPPLPLPLLSPPYTATAATIATIRPHTSLTFISLSMIDCCVRQ